MVVTIILFVLGYLLSAVIAYLMLAFCELKWEWLSLVPGVNTLIVLAFFGGLIYYGIVGID